MGCLSLPLKTLFFGLMKIIGNGPPGPTPEKRLLFYRKIFYRSKREWSTSASQGRGLLLENTPLGFDIILVNGHTEKQMLPLLKHQGKTLVFAADLIPTVGHLPIPCVMGYDTRPLMTMEEKSHFLKLASEKNFLLFLEHDPYNELISLKQTEKGVRMDGSKTYFSQLFLMKRLIYILLCPLMISCSAIKFVGNPITAPLVKYNKKDALVEYEKRFWHLMDLRIDSIAGMSVDRAHDELIKDQKGETVIVAVIDSGVDIDHPELKEAIWVNDDEIPNNRIDDDQNGYVDDVHGWNFLGDSELENMESVRLQRKETPGSEAFEKFEKDRLKNIQSKKEELASIESMIQKYHESDSIIKLVLGKEKYSLQEVEDFSPKTFALMEAIIFKRFLNENQLTKSNLEVYLKGRKAVLMATTISILTVGPSSGMILTTSKTKAMEMEI